MNRCQDCNKMYEISVGEEGAGQTFTLAEDLDIETLFCPFCGTNLEWQKGDYEEVDL